MKLVWCPEMASKAYIDGVRVLADRDDLAGSPEVAELLSAMAGGWNAQLVVEAPAEAPPSSSSAATSLALAAAARRTGGRYACVLPDGDEEAMGGLEGVDLLVVDARRRDAADVLRAARPGTRGMVVVRHGDDAAASRRRRGTAAAAVCSLAAGTRVVRSVYLPVGKGLEVLHVGVGKGPCLRSRGGGGGGRAAGRWIRHVNLDTGEEHVFRRQ
ncbi:hypothetical protein ACP4OV_028197 [Aristida adscensionis]